MARNLKSRLDVHCYLQSGTHMPYKSSSLITELVFSIIISFNLSYTGVVGGGGVSMASSRLLESNFRLSGSDSTLSKEQAVNQSSQKQHLIDTNLP